MYLYIFFTKIILDLTKKDETKNNNFWFFVSSFLDTRWTWNEREMNVNVSKKVSHVHSRSWTEICKKYEPDMSHVREWTEMNADHVHFCPSLIMIMVCNEKQNFRFSQIFHFSVKNEWRKMKNRFSCILCQIFAIFQSGMC